MSRSDHTVHRRTNKSTIYHLMRPSAPDSNPTAGWRDTVTGSWRLVEAANNKKRQKEKHEKNTPTT